MELTRTWLAATARASAGFGGALALLLAAIALVGVGGGLGGIGTLSQLIAGPAAAPGAAGDAGADFTGSASLIVAPGRRAAAPALRGPQAPGATPQPRVAPRGPDPARAPAPAPAAPRPQMPPPQQAPPPAEPPPTVAEQVRDTTRPVTNQLPAPVRDPVNGLVDTLVATCGDLGCP